MADHRIKNIRMAISEALESTFNTAATGNYKKFAQTGRAFYIASTEKTDDRGTVGTGTDLPNVQYSGYLNPIRMEISNTLDNLLHPMLMKRGSGSPVNSVAGTAAALGTHTHTFKINKTVNQLESSTLSWGLGGADKLWTGCVVDSWRVEQNRSEKPTFSASLVGTGKSAAIGATTYSAYTIPIDIKGAETNIKFTRDAATVYLADRASNTRRVINWNISLNNNNDPNDRRPGDPRNTVGTPADGHYVNSILTGDREILAELTIAVDDTMQEALDSLSNKVLTDFTISTLGTFIGSTTIQSKVEFVFPKVYLEAQPDGSDDNGLAVFRITVKPVYDSVADTSLTIVVVNDQATLV